MTSSCRSALSRSQLLQWFVFLAMPMISQGWVPTSRIRSDPNIRRTFDSTTTILMAKAPNSASKNSSFKGKKRRNDDNPSTGKPKTESRRPKSAAASAASPPTTSSTASRRPPSGTSKSASSVQLPNTKPHAPPWQVLSSKDAKTNVEKEKQRRELARQGDPVAGTKVMTAPIRNTGVSTDFLSEADRSLLRWKPFNPSTVPKGMQYVGSYLGRQLPPRLGVPEVAFLGRSNVGKSSLLNRLAAMTSSSSTTSSTSNSAKAKTASAPLPKDQARVGKTPGATAAVNLYAMLGSRSNQKEPKPILGMADLPGFGYAKLSREVQEMVQEAAERYLQKRKELALGILLVDIRRNEPSDDDRAVLAALYDLGVPLVVVATKVDKVSSDRELETSLEGIRQGLGLPEGQPLCISSVTGQGVKDMWRIILEACEDRVLELSREFKGEADENATGDGGDDDDEEELEVFDDDDEISYSQGYDWIQGTAMDLDDGEYDDDNYYDEGEGDEEMDDTKQTGNYIPESILSLKRRARDLERSGEI